jgi:hypothetical protein
MQTGAIANVLDWLTAPVSDEATIQFWLAGLVVVILLAFLWSRVVKQLVEG